MSPEIAHTLPPDPTACHPYYNGRPLPTGWAQIGIDSGYYIYAHYSNPDNPQWEHPDPPHDAPPHAMIDTSNYNRNFARQNFFRSYLHAASAVDRFHDPTTVEDLTGKISVEYKESIVSKENVIRHLEAELAQTKASLDAANKRIDSLKWQYDQLYLTFDALKVYLPILNN